jgi:hypothetical protein
LAERMGEIPSRVRQIRLERICMSHVFQRRARRARHKDVPGNPVQSNLPAKQNNFPERGFFIGRDKKTARSFYSPQILKISAELILYGKNHN